MRFDNPVTNRIPLPNVGKSQQEHIKKIADRILDLHKNMMKAEADSNKWNALKVEIQENEDRLNQYVYDLYRIEPEEIKIIESQV